MQDKLKLILEGEPPYDIFVRWKPLAKQAIGWHPDINDGVRMNIRPFLQTCRTCKAPAYARQAQIKWDKDRGKEPERDKAEYPVVLGLGRGEARLRRVGNEPDGNRWNDCHYTNEFKSDRQAGAEDTMSTVAERVVAALRTTAQAYAAGDQVAPCAVLWTDPERLWECVMPELQAMLPELFLLGGYAPEKRTGPALWLRCIEARVVEGAPPMGTTPILYLPGISREQLRAAEDCPQELVRLG